MKQDPRTIIDINKDPGLHRKPIVAKQHKLPIEIPTFHWHPDRPDNRDYIYHATITPLPSRVDLRKHATMVEDQQSLGSCTGNAIAGAIELINKKSGKVSDISRLFIYYYERLLMGTVNYDSGAYIRDGIKATSKWGAPIEKLWPYNISRFKTQPSGSAIKDAAKRKVLRYERATTVSDCTNALANGYPVIMGFLVYSSFMSSTVTRTGMMKYPDVRNEKLLGGHAVLLVGYDNNAQHFIVRNSWGTNWGDSGYFYMPFRVVEDRNMSSDFWVITEVNNP